VGGGVGSGGALSDHPAAVGAAADSKEGDDDEKKLPEQVWDAGDLRNSDKGGGILNTL
jgi:hypothetical protein